MAYRDWNNLGQDLNRIIEDAVYRGNFGHLNDTINRTVRNAFQGFAGNGQNAGDWDFKLSKDEPQRQQSVYNGTQTNAKRTQSGTYNNTKGTSSASYKAAPANTAGRYFAGQGKRRGGAIAALAGGIILLIISLVPLAAAPFVAVINGATEVSLGTFGVLALVGAILTVKGGKTLKLAGRFGKYIRCLNGKTYGDISMLAAYTHKPESFVLKDIKKMLSKGWFLQGHLDEQQKCLMVSDESYAQYLETVKNMKMQEQEKLNRNKMEEDRKSALSPEVLAVIEKGKEYIVAIRKSNDAIPGEVVSEKIYRMEMLVKRIFLQLEAHPENLSDLRKLMEYYLPMTMKLLKAYEELDAQPVQGENIQTSKKEIEDTLDTLNVAFEKLLDNLFQDKAWDVSADISVLNTMLAQEGLTDDGFLNK